jgi:hypothetical protein
MDVEKAGKALIVGLLLGITFIPIGVALAVLGLSYVFDFDPDSASAKGFWLGLSTGLGFAASVFYTARATREGRCGTGVGQSLSRRSVPERF